MPVDINDKDPKKGVEPAKKMLRENGLPLTDENIFIAATCKDKGIQFLKGEAKENVRKIEPEVKKEAMPATPATASATTPQSYDVTVNSRTYNVKLAGSKAVVNGVEYNVNVKEALSDQATASSAAPSTAPSQIGETVSVEAPLPGLVLRFVVNIGDSVDEGDTILILESMKMETPIAAPAAGTITSLPRKAGRSGKSGADACLLSRNNRRKEKL